MRNRARRLDYKIMR
ncbi:TPA: hypothetical protein ACNTRC_004730 [Escherichia coli]|nr:hypothetical protein [Escherichia coli]